MNLGELKNLMESGHQTSGITYWRHGEMVVERCMDLFSERRMTWRLPEWFLENQERILKVISSRMTKILEYQLWHDCGKPLCRTENPDGKISYPDHARISEEAYLSAGGDPWVASLIGKDMICHISRPSDAGVLSKDPDIEILLITALCEIHTNAEMFGGMDSDSFKIKWKNLNRLGRAIIGHKYRVI